MNKLTAVGATAVGGLILYRCLPQETRDRLASAAAHWIAGHMEKMIASLPEESPPRLVMSILPKLQAQNNEIIAMLQEQNELLRKGKRSAQ